MKLAKLPLSEKEKKKIRSLSSDFGVVTCEEEIDKVVYCASRNE